MREYVPLSIREAGGEALAAWHRGASYDDCRRIIALVALLATVYRPEGIPIWLRGRNGLLGNQRPVDLIAAGQFEEVERVIHMLRDGAFA